VWEGECGRNIMYSYMKVEKRDVETIPEMKKWGDKENDAESKFT
jgi:hypothetical protein